MFVNAPLWLMNRDVPRKSIEVEDSTNSIEESFEDNRKKYQSGKF